METQLVAVAIVLAASGATALCLLTVSNWAKRRQRRRAELHARGVPPELWLWSSERQECAGRYRLSSRGVNQGCCGCGGGDEGDTAVPPVWQSDSHWLCRARDGHWRVVRKEACRCATGSAPPAPDDFLSDEPDVAPAVVLRSDPMLYTQEDDDLLPDQFSSWIARRLGTEQLHRAPRTRVTREKLGFDWEDPHPKTEQLIEMMRAPGRFQKAVRRAAREKKRRASEMSVEQVPLVPGRQSSRSGSLQAADGQAADVVKRMLMGLTNRCNVSNKELRSMWMKQRAEDALAEMTQYVRLLEDRVEHLDGVLTASKAGAPPQCAAAPAAPGAAPAAACSAPFGDRYSTDDGVDGTIFNTTSLTTSRSSSCSSAARTTELAPATTAHSASAIGLVSTAQSSMSTGSGSSGSTGYVFPTPLFAGCLRPGPTPPPAHQVVVSPSPSGPNGRWVSPGCQQPDRAQCSAPGSASPQRLASSPGIGSERWAPPRPGYRDPHLLTGTLAPTGAAASSWRSAGAGSVSPGGPVPTPSRASPSAVELAHAAPAAVLWPTPHPVPPVMSPNPFLLPSRGTGDMSPAGESAYSYGSWSE